MLLQAHAFSGFNYQFFYLSFYYLGINLRTYPKLFLQPSPCQFFKIQLLEFFLSSPPIPNLKSIPLMLISGMLESFRSPPLQKIMCSFGYFFLIAAKALMQLPSSSSSKSITSSTTRKIF